MRLKKILLGFWWNKEAGKFNATLKKEFFSVNLQICLEWTTNIRLQFDSFDRLDSPKKVPNKILVR